jgi:hypothetical protein
MKHGRLTLRLAVALTAVLAVAGPALAAGPPGPGPLDGPHRRAVTGDRPGEEERPGAGTMTPLSAPGANGRIVYARGPYLAWPNHLWVMDADGSDATALTSGGIGQGDNYPVWSPGGTMIAFERDRTSSTSDGGHEIYVMQANGTGVKRLTNHTSADRFPSWAPDGSRLYFSSDRAGQFDVYSMKIDGSDVRRLTTSPAFDAQATASPDGTKLAFSSDRTGDFEIYTMNVDGSGVTRRTSAVGTDYGADWSPDGTKIAFTSDRTGNDEVFTMSATGAAVTNLSNAPATFDAHPGWSPDGSSVVFGADTFGDVDVYAVASTGGVATALAATADDEWSPDWQPIPAFPLVDARFSTFKNDIEWVYAEGITVGCSAERYCPNDGVTREQMAIFLDRALDLPATATDYFSDDTGRTGEASINRLRAANITTGCSATTYCPTATVTRGQMASFLARAFALPLTTTDYFSDDATSTHQADINRVAAAGITTGCGPTTYCPTASVTRGQMAAFLRRSLE